MLHSCMAKKSACGVTLLALQARAQETFARITPPFLAVRGRLMARVVRPSTDPELFAYLEPLIAESVRALDALPPDGARAVLLPRLVEELNDRHNAVLVPGPHDPKILMRVDWGTGEPLLPAKPVAQPSSSSSDSVGTPTVASESGSRKRGTSGQDVPDAGPIDTSSFLKRALASRASSLAAPLKKLKAAMSANPRAQLGGHGGHFINEVRARARHTAHAHASIFMQPPRRAQADLS